MEAWRMLSPIMAMTLRSTFLRLFILGSVLAAASAGFGQSPGQDLAAKPFHRVVFLGNSITKHGPKKDIGWEGNWGMAATAESKDYVHLVTAGLAKGQGTAPQIHVQNIAGFERDHATADVAALLKEASAFQPDLVILAIGENVPALDTDERKQTFKKQMLKVMKTMKPDAKTTLLVRSSFWANAAKDTVLKEACTEAGGVFVDIQTLGKDAANYAKSERPIKHEGVGRHPGDQGMQAIATALLQAAAKAR